MQSNAMDRRPYEIDPMSFTPMPGKCIIKRKKAPEKNGVLYIPQTNRNDRPEFQGEIVVLGDSVPRELNGVKVGDYAWFHYAVGDDDSKFIVWNGENYALIPYAAIQGILA